MTQTFNMEYYKTIQIDKKQVRVHRYIMEKYLNRKLKHDEIVHHINDNIADNRIENLEVLMRSDHMRLHRTKINNGKFKDLDIEKMKELYKIMPMIEVAKELGVTGGTICNRFHQHGIKANHCGYRYKKI